MPHPRLVLTNATFVWRRSCREWILAYMCLSSIGGIMVLLKLLTSLLTEVASMVGGW